MEWNNLTYRITTWWLIFFGLDIIFLLLRNRHLMHTTLNFVLSPFIVTLNMYAFAQSFLLGLKITFLFFYNRHLMYTTLNFVLSPLLLRLICMLLLNPSTLIRNTVCHVYPFFVRENGYYLVRSLCEIFTSLY